MWWYYTTDMSNKVKATGTVRRTNDGVRLHFSTGLARLWNWYLFKHTGMILHLPIRPSKISLWNPKQNRYKPKNTKAFIGKKVRVEFDLDNIHVILSKKGYWVYFINVECPALEKLISDMGVSGNFDSWNRPHMSIANSKYAVRGETFCYNVFDWTLLGESFFEGKHTKEKYTHLTKINEIKYCTSTKNVYNTAMIKNIKRPRLPQLIEVKSKARAEAYNFFSFLTVLIVIEILILTLC